MVITGQRGEVRWGYHRVATLGPWRFDRSGGGGTFTAQVTDVDEFQAQQAPLVVVVPAGQTQWRWPVRDVQITGSSFTGTIEAEKAE